MSHLLLTVLFCTQGTSLLSGNHTAKCTCARVYSVQPNRLCRMLVLRACNPRQYGTRLRCQDGSLAGLVNCGALIIPAENARSADLRHSPTAALPAPASDGAVDCCCPPL